MGAWVLVMFCNFYLVKNNKIANNATATKAIGKISKDIKSLELLKFYDVCLTNFKNNQILLNKISLKFLATIKLFTMWEILIWVNQVGWLVAAKLLGKLQKFMQKICNYKWYLKEFHGQPHDTQHNDIQHNVTQHNVTQHNVTQHNVIQHNGKLLLCWVSSMLSVMNA